MAKTMERAEEVLADWIAGGTKWVGLLYSEGDDVYEFTAGGGYGRVEVTLAAPTAGTNTLGAPAMESANTAEVLFGQASADKGTATHFAVFDAESEGQMDYVAPLPVPFPYVTGVQPRFEPGALIVREY